MKTRSLIGLALCVGLYACGGGDGHTVPVTPSQPSAPPKTYMISANDVYTLSTSKSETADPISVNGGDGASITGSDETSEPISVD